ncbi:Unknown protein sequence [Pseudomonas syringae pv. maculicola]|nr:Unknown protein sequence [Pseudomonas syringae pv. maculicola]
MSAAPASGRGMLRFSSKRTGHPCVNLTSSKVAVSGAFT